MSWREVGEPQGPVLIDTSVWLEALDPEGDPSYRGLVDKVIASGRAATCEVVIAEVLRGAASDEHAEALDGWLRSLTVLSCDGMGTIAAAMGRDMRAPRQLFADMLIAATASVHDAVLCHRDAHLSQIAARFGVEEVAP